MGAPYGTRGVLYDTFCLLYNTKAWKRLGLLITSRLGHSNTERKYILQFDDAAQQQHLITHGVNFVPVIVNRIHHMFV